MSEDTTVDVRTLRPGDRVRIWGEKTMFTVAVSAPCDLNGGWWHVEMEEPGKDTGGWPVSIRFAPKFFLTTDIERERPIAS